MNSSVVGTSDLGSTDHLFNTWPVGYQVTTLGKSNTCELLQRHVYDMVPVKGQ